MQLYASCSGVCACEPKTPWCQHHLSPLQSLRKCVATRDVRNGRKMRKTERGCWLGFGEGREARGRRKTHLRAPHPLFLQSCAHSAHPCIAHQHVPTAVKMTKKTLVVVEARGHTRVSCVVDG